jgi:ribosome modulation factor
MSEAFASILCRTEDACMKRQKRDRLDRAFSKGFQAGVGGRSKELCPYANLDSRSQWLGGWREGVDGRVNGLFNK